MNNVIAENDEPIHHSEGKTILRSCPSVLTFAQSGISSPLITISPPVTISPPDLQHVLEQRKLEQDGPHGKLKRFWKRINVFKKHRKQETSYNQYFIDKLTLEVSDNFNKIKTNNMINNINAFYCVIMNNDNNSDKNEQRNEKDDTEEADDADSAEVVEVQPVPASDAPINQPCEQREDDHFTFDAYIAEKETAHILRQWLHLMMDPIPSNKPKEKLIYLRAVSEAKIFTQKLPYKVYLSEFEMVSSNSYYVWMHRELKYDRDDIDVIIEQYQNYLAQFPK